MTAPNVRSGMPFGDVKRAGACRSGRALRDSIFGLGVTDFGSPAGSNRHPVRKTEVVPFDTHSGEYDYVRRAGLFLKVVWLPVCSAKLKNVGHFILLAPALKPAISPYARTETLQIDGSDLSQVMVNKRLRLVCTGVAKMSQ